MTRIKTMRSAVAVLLAAALILAAGGAAVASNMGFKLNMALAAAGAGAVGDNWVSIPYNNPYTTGCIAPVPAGQSCFDGLCAALGFGLTSNIASVDGCAGVNVLPKQCG